MVDQGESEDDQKLIIFSDEEIIVGGVLKDLQIQRDRVSSYFDLIPQEYREHVELIVNANFGYYYDSYGNDRNRFREDIARNWLARFFAFKGLAEKERLRMFNRKKDGDPQKLNRAAMAMLTASSSYVLIDRDAYDYNGPGAAGMYIKIPLRKEGASSKRVEKGVYLHRIPQVGKQLTALPLFVGSSRLVSIYLRDVAASPAEESQELMHRLDNSVTGVFKRIDTDTLRLK